MNLDAKIEAILFWKAEPVRIGKLAEILSTNKSDIERGLKSLENRLATSGLCLLYLNDEVSLGTNPEISGLIENLTKEEMMRDLGKAGLETLTIILYRSPISKSQIDYVRGVGSQFILRNLLIRGLIERVANPKDERSYLYKPTFDLIRYLGISKIEDLPDYNKIKAEVDTHEKEAMNQNESAN